MNIINNHNDDENPGNEIGTTVISKPVIKTKEPNMYRILLHNDDYTPMDFVVQILESVFHKDTDQATKIMLDVHRKGVGDCGTYTYDIAETKVSIVVDKARENEYPLNCTLEAH